MSNAFEEAFKDVIGLEGGYVNDPNDPGGETKFGISAKSYPTLDIAKLTVDEAKQIYLRDFWTPLSLDSFHPMVAHELFEEAVNLGKARAVRILQEALDYFGYGVEHDGVIGPQTIKAARNVGNAQDLCKVLNALQFMHYKRIIEQNPKLRKYAVGWLKRIKLAY